jgi:hypothetical protein
MFHFIRDFEHQYCGVRRVACTRELHPKSKTFAGWLAVNKTELRAA